MLVGAILLVGAPSAMPAFAITLNNNTEKTNLHQTYL